MELIKFYTLYRLNESSCVNKTGVYYFKQDYEK